MSRQDSRFVADTAATVSLAKMHAPRVSDLTASRRLC